MGVDIDIVNKKSKLYSCWLSHSNIKNSRYKEYLENVFVPYKSEIIDSALSELKRSLKQISDIKKLRVINKSEMDIKEDKYIKLSKTQDESLINDGYKIKYDITQLSHDKNTSFSFIKAGPSGKGRTTILNIIGLLEKFDEGELLIDGESNIKIDSSNYN